MFFPQSLLPSAGPGCLLISAEVTPIKCSTWKFPSKWKFSKFLAEVILVYQSEQEMLFHRNNIDLILLFRRRRSDTSYTCFTHKILHYKDLSDMFTHNSYCAPLINRTTACLKYFPSCIAVQDGSLVCCQISFSPQVNHSRDHLHSDQGDLSPVVLVWIWA